MTTESNINFKISDSEKKILYFEYEYLIFNGIPTKGHGYISIKNNVFSIDTQYGKIRRTDVFLMDAPPGATKKAREAVLLAAKSWFEANPTALDDAAVEDAKDFVKNRESDISRLLIELGELQDKIKEKKKLFPNVNFHS